MLKKMKCRFERLGVFVECASNSVPKISTLKRFADILAKMGYNTLYLGTADTYEIETEPYFGYMRGRYTEAEIKELDTYCVARGIELTPAIQTLAHLHFLPNYAAYRDYIDAQHILLAEDERTYTLIDKMFEAMARRHTSRRIHIGMDEAFFLGVGKYLELHGYQSRMEIMLAHLRRVLEIADKYGFKCEMWSDMFFRLISGGQYRVAGLTVPPEIKAKIPSNLQLVCWNYMSVDYNNVNEILKKHKLLSDNVGYAGGLWKWIGFAPDNTYSIGMGKNALDACENNNVRDFTLTLWADNGGDGSLFSILPSLFWYAQAAYGKTEPDKAEFKAITGADYDNFMLLDLLNNPHEKNYETLNNKHYWYLYNDILLGVYDSLQSEGLNTAYKKVAARLGAISAGEFTGLFKTLSALADVLSIKAELGKNLRKAYKNGDKATMLHLAEKDIPQMNADIDRFFEAFSAQWYGENKPFGFEVPCMRLGGLKQRATFVAQLIKDYLGGKLEKIDELEMQTMPFGYEQGATEDTLIDMTYQRMITNGFI